MNTRRPTLIQVTTSRRLSLIDPVLSARRKRPRTPRKTFAWSLAILALACVARNAGAQHGHLNAGAAGKNQNDALIWANGADFITSSGYVKTLDLTNAGTYAGYYQQNITLTVLPATPEHAGPDPQAPAVGSFLRARISCLQAPDGGEFSFWESRATNPTITVSMSLVSTSTWVLSEGDGSPGSDPYGHFHGRRLTATRPGLYKIGFQAIDTSTNGTGGGPIHTPSEVVPVWFQAGVNIVSVQPDYTASEVRLRLAPPANTTWQIEAVGSIDPEVPWQPLGSPVTGNDLLQDHLVNGAPGTSRFFRLKRLTP
jgi:hypothetical protein